MLNEKTTLSPDVMLSYFGYNKANYYFITNDDGHIYFIKFRLCFMPHTMAHVI